MRMYTVQNMMDIEKQPGMLLAANWIRDSTAIIVAAGDGMNASDNSAYNSTAWFVARFPAMVNLGIRSARQAIGHPLLRDNQALRWGYHIA